MYKSFLSLSFMILLVSCAFDSDNLETSTKENRSSESSSKTKNEPGIELLSESNLEKPGMIITIKNSLNHYQDASIAFKLCGEKSRVVTQLQSSESEKVVIDYHCFHMNQKDFVPYGQKTQFFLPSEKLQYLVNFSDNKEKINIRFNDTHFKSLSYWSCWDHQSIDPLQENVEFEITQVNNISYSCKDEISN